MSSDGQNINRDHGRNDYVVNRIKKQGIKLFCYTSQLKYVFRFIFYHRISHMPRSVQYVYRSQNLLKLNMQCQRTIPKENTKNKPPSLTFSKIPRTWSFHVVVSQRTAKKCTKNYNARAQLLFCSLNLLFCGVLVAVAVMVCLSSLPTPWGEQNSLTPQGVQQLELSTRT